MTNGAPLELDAVIFGGGAAGLWLLDALHRKNASVLLLEANELGSGQTIASQGIIHGGLKYTLSGLFSESARSIREMPMRWRRSLAGEQTPDLSGTRLRAQFCYLWETGSMSGRLAMLGAKAGLHIKPRVLSPEERPPVLAQCPGTVARLDEQVIDPASFLTDLANQHRERLLKIDARAGLEFTHTDSGDVELVRLINPETGEPLDLAPRQVIFTAGEGNAVLREMLRLDTERSIMQKRPLHMVMARGALPALHGHCVDGRNPRLTITSAEDVTGRTVWQIGGEIAEQGNDRSRDEQIHAAQRELDELLPHVERANVEWATYRGNRAEAAASGRRPDDVSVRADRNVITAWPTKLALVPKLVEQVVQLRFEGKAKTQADDVKETVQRWPRPSVALPPWETKTKWFHEH